MSDTYSLLKFLHLLAIIIWVGGGIVMLVLQRRFAGQPDRGASRALSQQGKFLSLALFMPAALVTLVTGIGLVHGGPYSFADFWVNWGMTAVLLSFVVGGAIAGRMSARLGRGLADGTLSADQAATIQRRLTALGVFNLLVLLSAVFVMVYRV